MHPPEFWLRLSREKRLALLLGALGMLGAIIWSLSRTEITEEQRIKSAVLAAVQAVENESPEHLLEVFSFDYRGEYAANYAELEEQLRYDFSLVSDIRISILDWQILVEKDYARVEIEFRFRLTYRGPGPYTNVPMRRLPSTPRGENDRARLMLVREDDGYWRILEIQVAIPKH